MIKGTFCPKELTVQWEKQAYQQPFSTEEEGVAEEAVEEKVGSFLLAWPNVLFLHYFYWACSFRLSLLL